MTTFSLPGPALATAAAWATRLNPSRPSAPPLAGVLLDATGEQLTLSATDYDTSGVATIAAQVDEPGRVLVAGRLLAAVTKTLGAKDTATLTVEDTILRLSIGKGQGWELPTLDLDLYPAMPKTPPAVVEVDAEELTEALARVLPAAGNDPTMPALYGAYISAGAGQALTIASTDRYRLAVAELDFEPLGEVAERGELDQVLVPRDLLEHIAAAARESGPQVRLLLDRATFGISGAARTVIGRQVDTEHLRWQRIALTEDDANATVVRASLDELRGAITRASVMLGDGESLTLSFTPDGVAVKPTLGGRGRAEHSADIDAFDGAEQTVGVSARFLHAALAGLASPGVELRFTGKAWAPFLVQPVGADGEVVPGFRHIVAQQRQAVVEQAA